jgi:hypothetical protein
MYINQREGRETNTHADRKSQKLVGVADVICMRLFNIILPYIYPGLRLLFHSDF